MEQTQQEQPVKLIYRRRSNNAKLDPANDPTLYKRIFAAGRLRLTKRAHFDHVASGLGLQVIQAEIPA